MKLLSVFGLSLVASSLWAQQAAAPTEKAAPVAAPPAGAGAAPQLVLSTEEGKWLARLQALHAQVLQSIGALNEQTQQFVELTLAAHHNPAGVTFDYQQYNGFFVPPTGSQAAPATPRPGTVPPKAQTPEAGNNSPAAAPAAAAGAKSSK